MSLCIIGKTINFAIMRVKIGHLSSFMWKKYTLYDTNTCEFCKKEI